MQHPGELIDFDLGTRRSGPLGKERAAQRDSLKRLLVSDAMLMGRVTYEALAAVWPKRTGAFANRFNTTTTYVF